MGCVAFLILHAIKVLDSPYDAYWFTILLSLDTQTLLRWWLWKRSGR